MARWPHLRAASGPVCWCCRSIGKDLAQQSSFERVALGCAPTPLCNTYNGATAPVEDAAVNPHVAACEPAVSTRHGDWGL